jgi:hypothetical protein
MRWLPWLVVLIACHPSTPAARSPAQQVADAAPAVAALRQARFADAATAATATLAVDPHNAQAAAARAIATYQAAGNALITELTAVLDGPSGALGLDHERGRAAWLAFLGQLDAVDRDLAVVDADPTFALELCLACWEHDWNRNGHVDDRDRLLFELEDDGHGDALPHGDPRRRPTFRFDVGDAAWARAMLAFQRAAVELILAYRWSELDKLAQWRLNQRRVVIHLVDAERIRHARDRIVAGLGFADRTRAAYLAETDDDREWVPNPRQRSHPMPLDVDDALYATWGEITGDVRRLLASEDGLSLRELGAVIGEDKLARLLPDAQLDLGRMMREPGDLVLDLDGV